MLEDLVSQRSHPNHWLNRASDLRAAAGAVWFSMENSEQVREGLGLERGFSMGVACRPVYHLLCGLALEVLLKGVLAERGTQPPATHNLLDLASQADVSLDEDEREVLRYYTTTIEWGGRYPLPLRPTGDKLLNYWNNAVDVLTVAQEAATGSWIKTVSPSNRLDWPQFHAIYGRFRRTNGSKK